MRTTLYHTRRRIALSVFACMLVTQGTSHAINIEWDNASGGLWTEPSNWNPAQVPTSIDDVFFSLDPGQFTVTLTGLHEMNSLDIDGNVSKASAPGSETSQLVEGVRFDGGGALRVLDNIEIGADGPAGVELSDGSSIQALGEMFIRLWGHVEIVSGTLEGGTSLTIDDGGILDGRIETQFLPIINNGLMRPGGSADTWDASLSGGYTQGATGVLELEIAGEFDFDNLSTGLPGMTLGGTLRVFTLEYTPEAGESFVILSGPSFTGTFDTVELPVGFSIEYNEFDVTLVYAGWVDATPSSLELGQTNNHFAAGWGDFDDDGDEDVHLAAENLLSNSTVLNGQPATDAGLPVFTDNTGPESNGGDASVTIADFDDDGFLDIFTADTGINARLWFNDGSGDFTDGTDSDVDNLISSTTAAAADFNDDGLMDLYVGTSTGNNRLLQGDPESTFIDATAGSLGTTQSTGGVAWFDFDNDGDQDILVAGSDPLILENTGGFFATLPVWNGSGISAVACAIGDVDNNGWLDFFLNGTTGHELWLNFGGTFTESITGSGLDVGTSGHMMFADIDNDGDLDGYSTGTGDTYLNNGSAVFTATGAGPGSCEDAAFGDFDLDGDLDLMLARGGSNKLMENGNISEGRNWLHIDLSGSSSNLFGVGARITVTSALGTQIREVRAGNGFRGTNSLTAEFGLDFDNLITEVRVDWPAGGFTQLNNVPVNQRITIEEDGGDAAPMVITSVSPNTSRAEANVVFNLIGADFNDSGFFSAVLTQAGQAPIVASGYVIVESDLLDLQFDLTGAAPGPWELEVSNSAGLGSLDKAVVVYDETVDLSRATTVATNENPAVLFAEGVEVMAFISSRVSPNGLHSRIPVSPDLGDDPQLVQPAFQPDFDNNTLTIVYATGLGLSTFELGGLGPSVFITNDSATQPAWSPVDDWIAYIDGSEMFRREFGNDFDVQLTSVTTQQFDAGPAWSPDGEAIAFRRQFDEISGDIMVIDSEGESAEKPAVPLTTAPGVNMMPAWSPNGRWIAFVSDRSGDLKIWIMDSRGEQFGVWQITTGTSNDLNPEWSSDGLSLYFDSSRSGDIYVASNLPVYVDTDGDGVPDDIDACPLEAPQVGVIDSDFDGCPDRKSSFRTTRFWSPDQLPVLIEPDLELDPRITDNSDYIAILDGLQAWNTATPQLTFTAGALGSSPSDAVSADRRNTITFSDADGYITGFLAVTLVTTVTSDTIIDGRAFVPGETVDADILFNQRDFAFSTDTHDGGPGAYDLPSVAIHELGHLYGFGHSADENATMFFQIPPNTDFRTLEEDDLGLARRAYPDTPSSESASGRVLLVGGIPVVGAAVFALDAGTDAVLRMTITGVDGDYRLFDIPNDFRLFTHPIDGSEGINRLVTGSVSQDLVPLANTNFLPEFYDGPGNESHTDVDGVFVINPGSPVSDADILINADLTGPSVVSTLPVNGAGNVAAITILNVVFDEPMLLGSISTTSFSITEVATGDTLAGTAGLLENDQTLVFTRTEPLEYGIAYNMNIGAGLTDKAGNPLSNPQTVTFTVEDQPPVSITGVSPAEVPVGGLITITGSGFDPDAPGNLVTFLGPPAIPATPFGSTPDKLFVEVPAGAADGPLSILVGGGPPVESGFSLTVLPPKPLPTASLLGSVPLSESPNRLSMRVDGAYAYVATENGVDILPADPTDNFPGAVTELPIAASGEDEAGANDVAALPDGDRTLVVCDAQPRLRTIVTDEGDVANFHNGFTETRELDAVPLGIAIIPGGTEALVVFTSRVVRLDITPGATFGDELQEWPLAAGTFLGHIAVSSSGNEAYANSAEGRVIVLALDTGVIAGDLLGGTEPRESAGSPAGNSFVNVDADGIVRLFNTRGPLTDDLELDGGFDGVTISPEGDFAYAANFILNCVQVLDLRGGNLVNAGFFEVDVDPTDIATAQAGRYLYVVSSGTNPTLQVFDTEIGPIIRSVNPPSGGTGALLTLTGEGFDLTPGNNTVSFGDLDVAAVASDGSSIVVPQPDAANTQALLVTTSGGLGSNAAPYQVVNRNDPGAFRLAHTFPTDLGSLDQLLLTPDSELLLALNPLNGDIAVLRAQEGAADLHTVLTTIDVPQVTSAVYMRITPDGNKLYVTSEGVEDGVHIFDVDTSQPPYLTYNGRVQDGSSEPLGLCCIENLVLSPDGSRLYIGSGDPSMIVVVDTATDAEIQRVGIWAQHLAVHPLGDRLFTMEEGKLRVFDTAGGLVLADSVDLTLDFTDQMVMSPEGTRLFVGGPLASSWFIMDVDVNAASPNYLTFSSGNFGNQEDMTLNSSAQVMYLTEPSTGISTPYDAFNLTPTSTVGSPLNTGGSVNSIITRFDDGLLYFGGIGGTDSVRVVDTSDAGSLAFISGSNQVIVANQAAPVPFQVQLQGAPLPLLAGTPLLFTTSGDGTFGSGLPRQYVIADSQGRASARYMAGPGFGAQTISVQLGGTTFPTPVIVVEDTTLAPPQIVFASPDQTDVPGVNTSIAVRFSKSIDPTSVDGNFEVFNGTSSTPLPGVFSYAEGGSRVTFSPLEALGYSSGYELQVGTGIMDLNGNNLPTGANFPFTTEAEPVLPDLVAVVPPAASIGDAVVLSGTGFGETIADNQVFFGSAEAIIDMADPGAIVVTVPLGADSATSVEVRVGNDVSSLPFTVLADEPLVNTVVNEVDMPNSAQHIAIVPDGSRAYMTSSGSNSIIPMTIDGSASVSETAIPVGLHPYGVASSPSGDRIYATNFFSNDISVIDATEGSPTFQQVLTTIPVGLNPTGLVSHPDGRLLYAVNYGDSTMSIIDTDSTSANLYGAQANVKAPKSSKTVDVVPDGGKVLVGTSTGFIVLDPIDGTFVAESELGQSTQDLVVTPDGAYAVVLTTENELFYVDIRDGSATQYGAQANVKSGKSSKTVDVTPDGGSIYVTNADGEVLVFNIVVLGGSGAAAEGVGEPISLELVDTIQVGENPTGLAFDPTGSGLLLVVNSGSQTVSFIDTQNTNPPPPLLPVMIALEDVEQSTGIDALLRIDDVTTGVATNLGSLDHGFVQSEALAVQPSTQRIYVVDESMLVEMDIVTGVGRQIGPIGFPDVDGIDFHPETEVLYGVTHRENRLLQIDPLTGVGTLVAVDVADGHRINDLAFHPDGRPFVITDGSPHLVEFDLVTGETVQEWSLSGGSSLESLLFSPDGDILYSAADRGSFKDLVTIDLDTSQIVFVSQQSSGYRDIEGLAWMLEEKADLLMTDAPQGPATDTNTLPTMFALHPAAPSPFAGDTTLFFDLPRAQSVTFEVYGVDGRLVRTLARNRPYAPGRHLLKWDGRDNRGARTANGVYFVRYRSESWNGNRKVVYLR